MVSYEELKKDFEEGEKDLIGAFSVNGGISTLECIFVHLLTKIPDEGIKLENINEMETIWKDTLLREGLIEEKEGVYFVTEKAKNANYSYDPNCIFFENIGKAGRFNNGDMEGIVGL